MKPTDDFLRQGLNHEVDEHRSDAIGRVSYGWPIVEAPVEPIRVQAKPEGWQCDRCGFILRESSIELATQKCGCGVGMGRWGVYSVDAGKPVDRLFWFELHPWLFSIIVIIAVMVIAGLTHWAAGGK